MRVIPTKFRPGGTRDCVYYTQDEADEAGVSYLPVWRECTAKGQWVLTDDGFVAEVIGFGDLRDGTKAVKIATGIFTSHHKVELHTRERENRHTFNGKNSSGPKRMTSGVRDFALLYAHGMNPVMAYMQAFPRSTEKNAKHKWRLMVRREDVRALVTKELTQTLELLGIDEEFILKRYKELAERADSDSVCVTALRDLGKIIGMIAPKKAETRVQTFVGISEGELSQLQGVQIASEVSGPTEEFPEPVLVLPPGDTSASSE